MLENLLLKEREIISVIDVYIEAYNDYKENFSNNYCENRELREEYNYASFHFIIDLINIDNDNEKNKILKGFKQIKEKYCSTNFFSTIKIDIKQAKDYNFFFETFIEPEWVNDKPKIVDSYNNTTFLFELDYTNQEKADELLIHNFLLIKNILESDTVRFLLNIMVKDSDIGRINTYITGHNLNDKNAITFNGKLISWNITSVNKLFPALFIDKETLSFLQSPITEEAWDHIIGEQITVYSKFSQKLDKKYWFILRACQNYLFSEYKDVHSFSYTILRKTAFSSSKFKECIKRVPLIAILIFAQYDHYYRSSMLKKYKDLIGMAHLTYTDFVVALQSAQDYQRYLKYQEMSSENNIKSLIVYDNTQVNLVDEIIKSKIFIDLSQTIEKYKKQLNNKRNGIEKEYNCSLRVNSKNETTLINDIFEFYITTTISEANFMQFFKSKAPYFSLTKKGNLSAEEIIIAEQKIKEINEEIKKSFDIEYSTDYEKINAILEYDVHVDIIAELFEASTIAEGLLQLIENSVEHANGGLLSMHIYNSFDKNDFTYLQQIYAIEKNVSVFWLEIELSDLCGSSIKENFIKNAQERIIGDDNLESSLKTFLRDNNDIFKLFFEPSSIEGGVDFWEKYYQIPGNQVHHYGLQIFESIIKSKNGIFVASGHNNYYSEKANIPSDIDIKGTSYRILLPLNHVCTDDKNIINNTTFEKMMSYKSLKEYYGANNRINQISILNNKILELIESPYGNNNIKEEKIKKIKIEIEQLTSTCDSSLKYMLLFDCSKLKNYKNYKLELLIKGLLLFLFSCDEKPPVAIFNLSSHDLLEITRIIALFYNKQGKSTSNMKNMQIYLKGNEIGEEILFAGEDLNWNAGRMQRIAMTRGLMFDYWAIAQMLMRRSNNNHNENYN